MQAKSGALGRTLAITVTTPTRELDSTTFLSDLIHPHTSYQVLASPPLLSYDADSLLLAAFPLSVNKLLDITLTFTILEQDKEVNYLGRYLIFDRRLIGIKLSSSKNDGNPKQKEFKKWPYGKVMRYKLSKRVIDYYINCGDLQDYQVEVLVGDFLVTIGDLRIGMLFESQLQEGEGTLYQYKKQGCEIFSVVCDIPRDPIFQASLNTTNARLATKTESILKRFSRQNNRLVLYCGSRIATPYALYLTNSFILDPELPEMNISPFYFSEAHSLTLLCNVKVISKDEVYNHRREKITDKFRNELYVDSHLLPIPINPGKNERIFLGKYKEAEVTSKQHRQLLKKMKIWYFFTSENKQNPFIISLPLIDGMEEIVNELFSLSKLISIPISSLLVFFKVNKDIIVSEQIQSREVKIYQSIQYLMADPQYSILNIYTQNRGQEQYLLTLSDKSNKIRVFYNSIQLKQKPEFRLKNEKLNKMSQFADSIVKNRICGYYKVLKEARKECWRFSLDEQLEAITVHLKNRLKYQVNLHPFFKNILSKNAEEIKQCLFQAQQASIQPYQSNFSIQALNYSHAQSQQKNTQLELKDKQFFTKMKQFRKSRNLIIKRLQSKCHKCEAYFDKIYLYRCTSCRTEICFICITESLEIQPKNRRELTDQLKCLVCKKLCNCSRCLGRQRPDQSFLNSSVFRLDNTSQRSITIQERQEKEDYKECCTACLIKGRKTTRIKISCSTCENVECLQCYRNQSKRKTPLGPDWQCLTCKPDEQVPAIELMPHIEVQRTPQPMDIEANNRSTNRSPFLNSFKKSSQRKASASRSNSPVRNSRQSPEKSSFNKDGIDNSNGYNNRQNNYRGRGRGGFNRNNNNNYSNSFNSNNQSQNRPSFDDKRSVSVSRSKSPPRKKIVLENEGGKANKKRSPSRSVSKSPPKKQRHNVNTNNRNNSPSRSVSKSPPRNQKANMNNKKKSPSRSVSKSPPKKPKESRSNSPKNKPNQQSRNRSNSRSVSKSPPKRVQPQKKRSLSKSKSPPKKQQEKRKSSPSRSRSPPNKHRNAARSNSGSKKSKSRSRSRSRSRENRRQKQSNQTPKLWNNQRRDSRDNWNNRDRNNNYQSNNRNDRGGRGRGRGGFNRGGNQGGYNRDNFRDNRGYNRQDNNRGYNNNYNNNKNNDEKDNSQLLNVSQANLEQNFDCDY